MRERERDLRHSGGDASAFISKHQCSLVSEIYGSVQRTEPERERERERENREKVSEQRSEREERKKGERERRERAGG